MRLVRIIFSALIASIVIFAAGSAKAECICRYKSGEIIEGQTACLATAKGRELARCEKVLNVTSWKFLGEPCPSAANDGQPISLPSEPVYSSG